MRQNRDHDQKIYNHHSHHNHAQTMCSNGCDSDQSLNTTTTNQTGSTIQLKNPPIYHGMYSINIISATKPLFRNEN